MESLISELTLGYLDDLTVGDNQNKAAADVLQFKNTSIVDPLLQSFTRRNMDDASLLYGCLIVHWFRVGSRVVGETG